MSAVKKAAKKTTPRSKSPGGVGRPNTKVNKMTSIYI